MELAIVLWDLVLEAADAIHSHLLVCYPVVQFHIPIGSAVRDDVALVVVGFLHAVLAVHRDDVALVVVGFLHSVLAVHPSLATVLDVQLVLDSLVALDLGSYYRRIELVSVSS